jgi:H+-translocating NAD(P) transhydrogenase subunit beta
MGETTSNLAYLVTIICFILALRFLSSPTTARRGNWIGAFGMTVAIAVTLAQHGLHVGWRIPVGGTMGAVFGAVGARRVRMTAMPQMVALFNGVGGGAAALVSLAEFHKLTRACAYVRPNNTLGMLCLHPSIHGDISVAIVLSALIGSVSFAGSMVAFAKLQELIKGRPITYPGQKFVNLLLFAGIVAAGGAIVAGSERQWLLVALIGGALVFGVLFVLPIGGADMPVVISLLNAFTGLATSATGFEVHSNVLIVSGMLVGASGTLLTILMGRAMNRSIANVLFGAFGTVQAGAGTMTAYEGSVRSVNAEDVAIMLSYAQKVVIVPGYGMAVAQAQHAVRELADELEKKGVEVEYAIHPVAGRMPGHMNVLLAEANVPYTALKEMDQINPEFPQTDVALVIGANDVVNPAARNEPGSPIYGMPILNVDQAHQIVVMKRSMATGFAGIDNPLFLDPKTAMLFGDAKDSVLKLVTAVKAL